MTPDALHLTTRSFRFVRVINSRALLSRGERVVINTLAATVRSQVLLAYTPNPGTAFYVGYNDDLNYRGYNQLNPNLNIFEPGFKRNTRTFFIKASYLIRRNLGKQT